jgi:hypothetical protein
MEAQVRRGLDTFAADAREASDIRWNHAQSITLSLPASGGGPTRVTYGYDNGTFFRLPGEADSTAPRVPLVRSVAPDLAFRRFRLDSSGAADREAANDLETKLIQLTLRATRTGATAVAANQRVFSTQHLLRNKRVTN